jgi:hypothetical protein
VDWIGRKSVYQPRNEWKGEGEGKGDGEDKKAGDGWAGVLVVVRLKEEAEVVVMKEE